MMGNSAGMIVLPLRRSSATWINTLPLFRFHEPRNT
jgi:hypothetical protein